MVNGIIIFAILLLAVWKVRGRSVEESYLSKEQAKDLKGLAAVLLIPVHIRLLLDSPGILYNALSAGGFLLVAIFFFYSGYGIATSQSKNDNYLASKLPRRILYLYLLIVGTELAYLVIYIIFLNKRYSITECIMYFLGINLLNGALWYIVALLVILTALFVMSKIFPNGDFVVKSILAVCIYIFLCFLCNKEPHKIQSCVAFILGGVIQKYEKEFGAIKTKRKWIFSFGVLIIIFCVSFLLPYISEKNLGTDYSFVRFVAGTIASNSFVLLMLLLLQKIEIRNSILDLLGEISTEIYLVHILVLNVFYFYAPNLFEKNNAILVSCMIIVITIVVALANKYIKNVIKKKQMKLS